MKLHFDETADALYLRLDDSAIVESEEASLGSFLISTCAARWWVSRTCACKNAYPSRVSTASG
jgi:hypothetical protein